MSIVKIDVSKELLNEIITATKQIMLIYKLQNSDLVDSIEWTYKDNQFVLLANDYFQYVDSGRRPRARKVPVEFLLKWMKKKGITPAYGQTYNSVAFAIQNAIYKAGIKSRPYTQLIIGATIDILSEALAENLSIQIADSISQELTFELGKN
jgi:hypothetical protein